MTDLTIIAHCGACEHFFDNSYEALQLAVAEGADMIELDLRRTGDGHTVVLHDATTYRVLGGGGTLNRMTLAELQAMRGPNGERVATLAEALALPIPIIHEFKEAGIEEELVAGLAARPDDIVSSFDPSTLERVARLAPSVKRGYLWTTQDWPEVLREAADHGAYSVHPSNFDVCPDMVDMARRLGMKVHVWSVGEAARAHQLKGWGVDGIMTYGPKRTRDTILQARADGIVLARI